MFNRIRKIRRTAVFLALVAVHMSVGQTIKSGPQVLTFFSDFDDTEQPYGLYLPPKYNPKKKYPLVVMLHGAGSNHRLALRRVFGKSNQKGETDVEATRYFPAWDDVNYIVISPLARGTLGYQGIPEKDVYDAIVDVKNRFIIDEDRVYLTGLSMGGGGTLWLGLTRPDIWAAIAPVCPAPPAGTMDLAPNALNIPVAIHQGGADPVVKPEGTRAWVKCLDSLGTKVAYTEYPGVSHNSWENAYENEAIFKWFSSFRRNRYPDRVRFVTPSYKYCSAYWVQLDALTPGTLAGIDAEFTTPGRIAVTTSGLGAFTLNLAKHPTCKAGGPVEVVIDGKAFRVRATDSLSFRRRDGVWIAEKYAVPTNAKRPGAEGPLIEAVAVRHVYVYGTADKPSSQELRARRERALRAADWGAGGSFMGEARPLLSLRAIPDSQVRLSDVESSNLILFGSKTTNSIIAKFGDRLPMHLNDSTAAGYGLVYVFPVDNRLVVVNSGLAWWSDPASGTTGPEPGLRPTAPAVPRRLTFMRGPASALAAFGDYALFKDSPQNIVVQGRFAEDWRVAEADAEKLKSTGVVTLTGN